MAARKSNSAGEPPRRGADPVAPVARAGDAEAQTRAGSEGFLSAIGALSIGMGLVAQSATLAGAATFVGDDGDSEGDTAAETTDLAANAAPVDDAQTEVTTLAAMTAQESASVVLSNVTPISASLDLTAGESAGVAQFAMRLGDLGHDGAGEIPITIATNITQPVSAARPATDIAAAHVPAVKVIVPAALTPVADDASPEPTVVESIIAAPDSIALNPGHQKSESGGVIDTVLDPLLGEGGVVDTVLDPLLGEGGVIDTVLDPLLGEGGVVDTVLDPLLGEGGVIDTVLDPLLGEGGVIDTVLDPLLGEGGVIDTVLDPLLGEGGVVDTVLDPLLGEGGVVDTVLDPLLGEGGVVDTVLDPLLGEGGVVDTVLDPLLGEGGVVDTVLDPLLGEGGVIDTVLDPLLGEGSVVGAALDPLLGEGGVVDTVLSPVLTATGPVGGLVDTLLGGLFGGGRNRGTTSSTAPTPVENPEMHATSAEDSEDTLLEALLGGVAAAGPIDSHESLSAAFSLTGDSILSDLLSDDLPLIEPVLAAGEDLLGELLGVSLTGALADGQFLGPTEVPVDPELDDLLNEILDSGERAVSGVLDPVGELLGGATGALPLDDLAAALDIDTAVDSALEALFGPDSGGLDLSGTLGGLFGGLSLTAPDEDAS